MGRFEDLVGHEYTIFDNKTIISTFDRILLYTIAIWAKFDQV